jgi:hypothetical protein
MPKRIWNGAQPEVELVLPEGSVVVKHGESVEVDADTARNLDEQENNWLGPQVPCLHGTETRADLERIAEDLEIAHRQYPTKAALIEAIDAEEKKAAEAKTEEQS